MESFQNIFSYSVHYFYLKEINSTFDSLFKKLCQCEPSPSLRPLPQITVIGRYGSTNARAKIPLGFYYGHTYILPWETELKLLHDPLRGESEAAGQPDVDQHLAMMVALQEDIQCRWGASYYPKLLFIVLRVHLQNKIEQMYSL